MKKRYICFVCYKYHPEMRGVSEEEFNNGDSACAQPKCARKGQPLESAIFCGQCDRLFPASEDHTH